MAAPLQNSRFQELLKRLFGFKQDLGAQVIEDIVPVADTHDVQAPESYRLRAENLWAIGLNSTNGAGVANRIQIGFDPTTPPRSQLITIIDEIRLNLTTGPGSLLMGITPNLNLTATGIPVRYRDGRSPSPNNVISPAGFTQILADAPTLGTLNATMGSLALLANAEQVVRLGVVLVPGTKFEMGVNGGSQTLNVFVLGRERAMDGSEAT